MKKLRKYFADHSKEISSIADKAISIVIVGAIVTASVATIVTSIDQVVSTLKNDATKTN